MKFTITQSENPNVGKYSASSLEIAYEFSKKMYKEFGTFLKAIVIFGSAVRKQEKAPSDIDMLIIIDDLTMVLSPEIVQTYRIITEKIISEVSKKLHVTTLKLTGFWDYIRNCDPVGINILRDGYALIDTGFFDPLQSLLMRGRIRPTEESIWTYFSRAPRTLQNSEWHLMQATIDLYWAVVDAAHAVLMKLGEIPPSPSHVGDLIRVNLDRLPGIESSHADTMDKFYNLAKDIESREMRGVSGIEYDSYLKEAADFVEAMRNFIETYKK